LIFSGACFKTMAMEENGVKRPAARGSKKMSMVSWILLGVTLALSFTSFLGFGIWFLPWPVAVATLVVGLIVYRRGGKGQGISLIFAAILIVPFSFGAQFVSLAVYGFSAMKEEQRQEMQMLENLRVIDRAKGQWVAQTKARKAAPVTLANLTSYLGGREVKPVVDERYDPRPVGQPPTATLPDWKHLWSYPSGGAAYTAAGLEQILAQSTSDPINMATGEFLHPSGRWLPDFWTSSPNLTVVPTSSPAAATSPKPTASPDSTVRETPSATPDGDD
jgi:hypothetical protein